MDKEKEIINGTSEEMRNRIFPHFIWVFTFSTVIYVIVTGIYFPAGNIPVTRNGEILLMHIIGNAVVFSAFVGVVAIVGAIVGWIMSKSTKKPISDYISMAIIIGTVGMIYLQYYIDQNMAG